MAEWRERGYVPDSDDEGSDEEERADHFGKHNEEREDGKSDAEPTIESSTDLAGTAQQLSNPSQHLTLSPPSDPKATTSRISSSVQDATALDELSGRFSPETSTAEKLEAQLANGLQTCRDVLKSRPTTPELSDVDSPLSSLPSSPEASVSVAEAQRSLPNQRKSHSPSPASEVEQPAIPASTLQAALIGRSFRPRALMQLHPYTIEYAKYQKDWKARGLPPIRSADPQARRHDETRGTATFNSSQNVGSSSRPSSPMTYALTVGEEESHTTMQPIRPVQHQHDMALDDELPDLADILRGDARESGPGTVLDRKRKAKGNRRRTSRPKKLPRLDLLADEAQDLAAERERSAAFDMLLSPPRSARIFPTLPTSSEEGHASLEVATPRPPPTPVLSSDRQATMRDIIDVSSSSESETESGDSVSSSLDVGAGGDESQGLMQMRRKIKGVLPASWLRLDAQHQKQPAALRQHPNSPEKGGPSRGLAKHVVMSGRSIHDEDGRLWPPDLSSDEDGTESVSGDREFSGSATSQQFRVQSAPGDDDFMDGVIVEDEVDAMVPAASRASRQGARPRKKRQQRIDDGWIVDDQNTLRRDHRSGQPRRHSASHKSYHKSGHKRRKIREKQQQLTVFDAPGFTVERDDDVPRFLRVAARVKGSGRGATAQDAKEKFFQLSTTEDTAEINTGLRDWTTGISSRRRSSKSHAKGSARLRQNSKSSRHAQPRPAQVQAVNIHADSDAQIRKLKTSTTRTLTRLQQQADPSPTIDGASSATDLGQEIPRRRHLGVFLSHINRSGSGSFLNTGFARAGQLEAPHVTLQLQRRVIRGSQAVERLGPDHYATAAPPHPAHFARPLHVPQTRKRKLPPKMAAAANAVAQRPRAGSDFSEVYTDHGETQAEYVNLRDRGINNIASHFRTWSRGMSNLPTSVILQDLQALVTTQFGRFSGSSYISERHFAQVLDDLNSRREYIEKGPVNLAILPSSITAKANRLVSQFDMLALMPDPWRPTLSQKMIHNVFSTIEVIQRLLGDKSWFGDLPTSAKVPSTVLDCLERALQAWKSYQMFPDAIPADRAMACFGVSQLLVCAYQIADITAEADDIGMLQRALAIVEDAAYKAVISAVEVRFVTWHPGEPYEGAARRLPPIYPRPQGTADFLCQYHGVFRSFDVTYVVDTIIIVYHLTHRYKLPGAKLDFYSIMHSLCWNYIPVAPLTNAALLMAFMRLIHPLTRLDIVGEKFLDAGFNGWQLISPAVQAFLVHATWNKTIPNDVPKQDWAKEHSVLMIHCFAFVSIWEWEDPDLLLGCMFDVYAKNNMVDLCLADEQRTTRFPFAPFVDWLDDQTDFETFLSLVTVVLRRRVNLARSADAKVRQAANNKLSTLIFRLLPNNTLPFQGKKEKIEVGSHRCLWNHYDLYLTLYANVPAGRGPRVHLFEELVDYKYCSSEIRRLIIDVWADVVHLATSATDKVGDLKELASWAGRMLAQLVEEYNATNVSLANASAEAMTIDLDSRETLSGSVGALLRVWGSVLNHCSQENVYSLLPYTALTELATFFSRANKHLSEQQKRSDALVSLARNQPRLEYPETILQGFLTHPGSLRYAPHVAAMQVLDTVLWCDFGDEQFCKAGNELARSIVSAVFSCKGGCSIHDGETCGSFSDVLRAITEFWFDIASRSIGLNRSWDEYLVAPSPLSFTMLSDSEYSRQAKVLFMARIVEDSPMHFIMDRTPFYASWIEGLVVPEHLMRFEHMLSAEIRKYDQSKAFLGDVLNRFAQRDEILNFSLNKLRRERLEIISHLLARIYTLQVDPPVDEDSQLSLDGILTSGDLAGFLKVMTNTMKKHFRLLSGERQSTYQNFIHKVLVELSSYDFEDFRLDKWFTDPNEPEFPKLTSGFGHYFVSPVGAPAIALNKNMVRAFRVSMVNAVVSGEQAKCDLWQEDMLAAFDCSKEQLTNDAQLKVDSCLQTQFVRVVFPAYVELAAESPVAVPLLCAVVRLLAELVKRAYARVKEAGDCEEFCEVGLAVLRRVAGSEAGGECGFSCLEVSGEELEMRKWAKGDLLACEGMEAGDWAWEGWEGWSVKGTEEAMAVVKEWEFEREKEIERIGWEALGLTFE